MILAGTNQSPSINLKTGELFDFNFSDEQFDFVFLSGALNEVVDNDGSYAKSIIKQMFRIAKHGVAFNLLNAKEEWINNRPDLQSFNIKEILVYCNKFCQKPEYSDSYLDNDFTVFLDKKL